MDRPTCRIRNQTYHYNQANCETHDKPDVGTRATVYWRQQDHPYNLTATQPYTFLRQRRRQLQEDRLCHLQL